MVWWPVLGSAEEADFLAIFPTGGRAVLPPCCPPSGLVPALPPPPLCSDASPCLLGEDEGDSLIRSQSDIRRMRPFLILAPRLPPSPVLLRAASVELRGDGAGVRSDGRGVLSGDDCSSDRPETERSIPFCTDGRCMAR